MTAGRSYLAAGGDTRAPLFLGGFVVFAQRSNPDVAEPDWISMFVEFDEPVRRMWVLIIPILPMTSRAEEFGSMEDHGAVVENGHETRLQQLFIFIPSRGFPNDIVSLPLSRGLGRIHQRGSLPVNR